MIIILPRHVSQSAELSSRAQIPAISRLLLSAAHWLAKMDDKAPARHRFSGLNDHIRRDIGQAPLSSKPVIPSVNGFFIG